jgi:L-fuculose-phosphate aldolase
MQIKQFIEQISIISLSMFRKDFIGIYHGAFSVKTDNSHFLINTKNAIFDHITSRDLIALNFKEDYRWKEASMDAKIHRSIYQFISNAKYVAFVRPPYTIAYTLTHKEIIPQDYFGQLLDKNIKVYDIKDFEGWYERAENEVYKGLLSHKSNFLIIRGYGIYVYARDINELAQTIDILEHTCKVLTLSARIKV